MKKNKRKVLTDFQTEIVDYLVLGEKTETIAKELKSSRGSINRTIGYLKKKYGAKNRIQLALLIYKSGLLSNKASKIIEDLQRRIAS